MAAIGLWAQTACVWEVAARKPGNVHRGRDFADVNLPDFLLSAAAVGPILDTASARPLGRTILDCVRATRGVTFGNTNLGIVLLLAPLATVPEDEDLRAGGRCVLANTTVEDARLTYEAIRLANPGGLGGAAEQDVRAEPTAPLRDAMALAADRDAVARQYATDFAMIFDDGTPTLCNAIEHTKSLEGAIVLCHLYLMGRYPDTLIARKRGVGEAEQAAAMAREVLQKRWPSKRPGWEAFAALDSWLRAEGNARNPGATADLVTACLFVALRTGSIELPPRFPWSSGWSHD